MGGRKRGGCVHIVPVGSKTRRDFPVLVDTIIVVCLLHEAARPGGLHSRSGSGLYEPMDLALLSPCVFMASNIDIDRYIDCPAESTIFDKATLWRVLILINVTEPCFFHTSESIQGNCRLGCALSLRSTFSPKIFPAGSGTIHELQQSAVKYR